MNPQAIAQLLALMSGEQGGQNQQFPLTPVGDVINMPPRNVVPYEGSLGPTGPTNRSAPYFTGQSQDLSGTVRSINPDPQFWLDWVKREQNRRMIEQMGGLRG